MAYQIMFYGGMAGAAIALVISIVLYVKMGIAGVIEDLTGWNLRKTKRRIAREQPGDKAITNEIMLKKQMPEAAVAAETELMSAAEITGHRGTAKMGQGAVAIEETAETCETALLDQLDETTLLTDVDETTLLTPLDETTLLAAEQEDYFFKKEIDVMVVHSTTIM
ncbi:hypothetical protein [Neobacillus kokaensis]|uniref:Uncharacterized protein n=1 Tax=Neobacillus kokaensis TaxID=2759023 RepID=A0ABQ3N1D2_9BACI|nr:hypothetical protein [Neobacillus kokaensis]GHH98735.1 hypothetical protein AM1BK_22780 [Neobacillus kokaensis]